MTPPHHRPNGGFRNPWPGELPHELKDFLRWRRERREHPREPTPRTPPPMARSGFDAPRAAEGMLTATWVGHASVLLQLGRLNVLTDPMWSQRASPVQWVGPRRFAPVPFGLEALPPIDIVLLSHNHYDHLDRRTVRWLARNHERATWFCPLGVAERLRRWGVADVRELDWWDRHRAADADVTCTPARHFSGRTLRDRWRTLWCGWVIRAAGRCVFFAGDTAYHPEFTRIAADLGPFDLALVPIGAYEPRWFMSSVHMNPDDAMQAYADLAAAHPAHAPPMLPIHWGTFRLTDEPVEEPPARMRELWTSHGYAAERLWLLAHGETRRRGNPG